MTNKLLKQEEIDALLGGNVPGQALPEMDAEVPGRELMEVEPGFTGETSPEMDAAHPVELPEEGPAGAAAGTPEYGRPAAGQDDLSGMEKDALGEIGNICMGSAATTLSMLLNQKVSITSPEVSITTLAELFKGFAVPHMTIHVSFTEGLSGYNILIMKLQDAAVLADLMMGGSGADVSGELSEIGVSAASEAMNQMIGSASTSMAKMFDRTVNISPPETKIYHSKDDLKPPELSREGPVVVVMFKMTVGEILDTQIMQVMGMDTAREEAGMILGQLPEAGGMEQPPLPGEHAAGEPPGGGAVGSVQELSNVDIDALVEDFTGPGTVRPAAGRTGTPAAAGRTGSPPAAGRQAGAVAGARPSAAAKTQALPSGIDQQRLSMILDIPLKVTVLLGRTRWPIKDILGLSPGSVIELQSLVDEPVEVLVNGALVAMGEVVVVNENFGVRITNIIGPEERIQNLGK